METKTRDIGQKIADALEDKVYCKHCLNLGDDRGRNGELQCISDNNMGTYYSPEMPNLSANGRNENNDCSDFRDRREKKA